MSNTAPEKLSANAAPQKSEKLENLAASGVLDLPAIKELLKDEALAMRIRSIMDKISITYAYESNEQVMKFSADLKDAVELDESLVPNILTTWENNITKYASVVTSEQKTQVAEQKTQVAEQKTQVAEQKTQVAEQKTQVVQVEKAAEEQKIQVAKLGEDSQAIESREYATKGFDTVILGLSVAKKRILELTGKSPESIIGEKTYSDELAKNEEAERKIWESKNGSLAKLSPEQQQSAQKEIRAVAEIRVLETFRTKIVDACPEGSKEELNKALDALVGPTGSRSSIVDGARTDPKISASEYQLAKTISGDRRDIYQDGHVTRAVADEKGIFPSFVPGKGLYMNTDHLNIRIQLTPEDELRVNDLQSAEIKDKIQLDSLKTADTKENLMRQSTARNAWSKTMIEWSRASEGVQKILKQKGIDLSQPEKLKDVLNQGTISALRTDPELQTAIKKGIDDGSEFAPAEFFNGLDSLAVFLKQNNEDTQLKRTATINQLQAKLDSKNPDSYSNLTKSIYEQAYETSRKNLLILTEEFGLDGAGQQFVDNFLAILNEHRAGAAKLNLSKELTPDKKKDIALALNALIKKNPPLFSVQNGEVDTQISPIERKKAILEGLREQKFLLPPDDRVSETGIRNALGSK